MVETEGVEAAGEIEVAGAGDRESALDALARAFFDDPVAIWSTPPDRHRPAVLRRFFGAQFDVRVGEETVYVDAEGGGAAIWALPGRWRASPRQQLGSIAAFAHPRHWRRAPRVARGLVAMEHVHSQMPEHFYLATLGVSPDRQGEGVGSRLLAPVLSICDSEGIPAYLESSKYSNIAFYARHGFRVVDELHLPGGGPVFFRMWREPLPARR